MHFIYSNKRYPQPSKDVSLSPAWSYIQRVTCIALTLFDFWKTARTFLTLCLLNGYSSLEWATESVKRGSRSITSIIPHSHHPPAPPCLSCLSPSPCSSPPSCSLLVLLLSSSSVSSTQPGWQNLATFRREQKWQWKFSSNAYLQFSRQMRPFCA